MKKENSSYSQIIKSTSIFGGSQVLVILLGLIRTKIIAILLGPFGVGLIGIYQAITDVIRTSFGLGIDTAGVKEIAAADNNPDKEVLYKTISVLNKWFTTLALLALLTCVILCYPISLWALGNGDYALYIALLSLSIASLILATGRSTILQGMRKIQEMAKAAVWGSILSLVITIPVYYIWKIDGIIPALIANGMITLLCAEWYYRKQKIKKVQISNTEAFKTGINTLRLGLYIVIAGFIGTASMFIIKAFVSRNIDVDAAGLFQSAWVITNVYLGLILKSMGSDFYPRLSAIANKKDKLRTLVNEQTYIVLIVASPIIVGMLLFSGFVLQLLYSSQFSHAETLLRWQVLGSFLKVICWPVSFILLAKNKGLLFLITEIIFYASYLATFYILYPKYELDATAIAYFAAYIIYSPVIMIIGYKISGFRWNMNIVKRVLLNALLISIAFYIAEIYDAQSILLWSLFIFAVSLAYALYNLRKVFGFDELRSWFKRK